MGALGEHEGGNVDGASGVAEPGKEAPASRPRRGRVRRAATAVAKAPVRFVGGFWRGFRYPLRGARFVYLEHPGLVRIWIFPVLLTFGALLGAGWFAVDRHADLAAALWSEPGGEAWWAEVLRWLHAGFEWLVLLLLLVAAVLLAVVLSTVFAAPFNDALSERVEEIATGRPGPEFSWRRLLGAVLATVALESVKWTVYLLVMGPLWVLSLSVPVVGQVLYAVFGFVFSAAYFAIDYVDYAAARAGWTLGARIALLRRRTSTMLGFGTGVWGLLFVPLLNLFFMPAAVAGGTLLFLEMTGAQEDAERGEEPTDSPAEGGTGGPGPGDG